MFKVHNRRDPKFLTVGLVSGLKNNKAYKVLVVYGFVTMLEATFLRGSS